MQEQSDTQLLRDYAEHGHEAALREIVSRHADVVYASALRQAGSPDLARDIAQSVFTDLARKARSLAGTLNGDAALLDWLYRSTRFAALNQLRDDRRRHARERLAMQQLDPAAETTPEWERVQPVLDEAMAELSDEDREALLLRFFKNRDFRAIGAALGISDDAAQKRLSRALQRLHTGLASRGVTTTAGALSALLVAETVSFAPAGLAATLSTAALAGTTLTTTATAAATKAIAMTTLQKTLIAATLAAAVGTGIYEARQASTVRTQVQILQQQQTLLTEQSQQVVRERDEAARQLAALREDNARLNSNTAELLRLRGEIGVLRSQSKELELMREANRNLRATLAKSSEPAQQPDSDPDESPASEAERQTVSAKLNDAQLLVWGLAMYSSDNEGRLPDDLSQITNFGANAEHHLTGTNQFELVLRGSLKSVTNPSKTIVIREKDASFLLQGRRVRTYGFADGHAELPKEPPQGFEQWEKLHIILPPPKPSP